MDGSELTGRVDEIDCGRFELLASSDTLDDDEFFECDCDNADFRFEIRNERRIKQQERRKQEGQHRKGRTRRQRVAVAAAVGVTLKGSAVVQSHNARKRLCRLMKAKMCRIVAA